MFRNRPEYRFEGRLHEQIAQPAGYLPARVESAAVRIEHYGYLAGVRYGVEVAPQHRAAGARPAERGATAFTHYNLGAEYAASGDAPARVVRVRTGLGAAGGAPRPHGHEFAPALMRGWCRR